MSKSDYIVFMSSIRDEVIEAVSKLPEDAKIQDIKDEVAVIEKIERGLDDVENGRYKSAEEFKKDIDTW